MSLLWRTRRQNISMLKYDTSKYILKQSQSHQRDHQPKADIILFGE